MNVRVDIEAFVRGEMTAEELTQRIGALVRADPGTAADIIAQLDRCRRDEQVTLDVFMDLVDTVRSSSQPRAISTYAGRLPNEDDSQPTDTGPTETNRQAPIADEATSLNSDGPMPPGSVVRGRFVIDSVLGMGGMGIVYKAVDKVREEAQDKKPHVALKVLNADFKRHPQAFIALQRECSRTQRLAHPNIATVYDFDRSEDAVFMTMELLEGMPLDVYIKKVMPKKGLPFDEALRIIEGMGNALSYAHQHGIVHSDFKPGNAFLCDSGLVKVLDFGIARATKEPGKSDTTIFDAAILGALTPAYASPEMHDGLETDPRDDIYALACVAYELLAGKHPFRKQAANTARARGLTPARIPGLPPARFKALSHALAFERAERTPSVEAFLDELRNVSRGSGKKWLLYGIGIAAVTALIIGGGWWYLTYRTQSDSDSLLKALSHPTDVVMLEETLMDLALLDPETQTRIIQDARTPLLDWFVAEAARLTDKGNGGYAFTSAEALLNRARELYPDSAILETAMDQMQAEKDVLLQQLGASFEQHLSRNEILDDEVQADITDVMRIIQQVDSQHPLLKDPRLLLKYLQDSKEAYAAADVVAAQQYLAEGLNWYPESSELLAWQAEMQGLLSRGGGVEQRIAVLRKELVSGVQGMDTLQGFARLKANVDALTSLAPDAPELQDVQQRLKSLLNAELARLVERGDRQQARLLLATHAAYLDPVFLEVKRKQIVLGAITAESQAPERADQAAAKAAAEKAAAAKAAAEAKAKADADAKARAAAEAQQRLEDQRRKQELAEEAARKAEAERQKLAAEQARLKAEKEKLAQQRKALEEEARRQAEAKARKAQQAETERRRQTAAAESQQKLLKLKERFEEAVNGGDLSRAATLLDEVKGLSEATDTFVTSYAPGRIADSYLALAGEAGRRKDFQEAIRLCGRGLAIDADNPQLGSALRRFRALDSVQALVRLAPGAGADLDARVYLSSLQYLRENDPAAYTGVAADAEAGLLSRIAALKATDSSAAARLRATALQLFPDSEDLRNAAVEREVRLGIVAFARANPLSGVTSEEYSRSLGESMARQLGVLMQEGKLIVTMMTAPKWSKMIRGESNAYEASRAICNAQNISHILTAILTPPSTGFGGSDLDGSDAYFSLYACEDGTKVSKKYTVNSRNKDSYRYELGMRESLTDFIGVHPFYKSD